MATVSLDLTNFRALFPVYVNPVIFTDAAIQAQWDLAASYITDNTNTARFLRMTCKQQRNALNLMTAHLVALGQIIASGQNTGLLQGATIDKVSVTLTPPPEVNQWQWWLNQTPYGQQLLSLLQTVAAGGFFYNPRPILGAFRR